MVIWPAFRMGQYRVNNHPYHAPQFICKILYKANLNDQILELRSLCQESLPTITHSRLDDSFLTRFLRVEKYNVTKARFWTSDTVKSHEICHKRSDEVNEGCRITKGTFTSNEFLQAAENLAWNIWKFFGRHYSIYFWSGNNRSDAEQGYGWCHRCCLS